MYSPKTARVVVWWPTAHPDNPAKSPLGRIAQRRITDSAAAENPLESMTTLARTYAPGDTDFTRHDLPLARIRRIMRQDGCAAPLVRALAVRQERVEAGDLSLRDGDRH